MEKRIRTKKILKELRKTNSRCRIIQADFKKKEVVGIHEEGRTDNEQPKVI